jgi:hypothetical protein
MADKNSLIATNLRFQGALLEAKSGEFSKTFALFSVQGVCLNFYRFTYLFIL